MRITAVCFALLVVSTISQTHAENWPHWRGPTGNGIALNANPPTQWSNTKNVKWKVEIPGRQLASPVIWENQVFATTAVPVAGQQSSKTPTLEFKLLCFDRSNGDKLWEQVAIVAKPHQGTHATNGFATAAPCTDGEHVYAHFGSRGLYCYDMSGDFQWKKDDFGNMDALNGFGEGSSPTIADNMIIVPWDHEGPSAIYGLDKLTGETIWKTDRNEPTCWATPLIVEHNGRKQVIMNGQISARSYDLQTGKEIWRCGGQSKRPVASPVTKDGIVYIGSGFRGSFFGAFHLDGKGDIEGTDKVAWVIDRGTPDIASPLLSSGRIYFYKGKTALLSCVNASTGKPYYMGRRIRGLNTTYASPMAAGGYVYLTATNGTTVVIKDSAELSVVATNSVGEFVSATPAAVDDQLFIRGVEHLFCIAATE